MPAAPPIQFEQPSAEGPFSDILSKTAPRQSKQHPSGTEGRLGQVAFLGTSFLEGIQQGRLRSYMLREREQQHNLGIITGVFNTAMANQNLPQESRDKVQSLYMQVLGKSLQKGLADERGGSGKAEGLGGHVKGMFKEIAVGMAGGPMPKGGEPIDVKTTLGLLEAITTKTPGVREQSAKLVEGMQARVQEMTSGGQTQLTQEDFLQDPQFRDLHSKLASVAGPDQASKYLTPVLSGFEPRGGVKEQLLRTGLNEMTGRHQGQPPGTATASSAPAAGEVTEGGTLPPAAAPPPGGAPPPGAGQPSQPSFAARYAQTALFGEREMAILQNPGNPTMQVSAYRNPISQRWEDASGREVPAEQQNWLPSKTVYHPPKGTNPWLQMSGAFKGPDGKHHAKLFNWQTGQTILDPTEKHVTERDQALTRIRQDEFFARREDKILDGFHRDMMRSSQSEATENIRIGTALSNDPKQRDAALQKNYQQHRDIETQAEKLRDDLLKNLYKGVGLEYDDGKPKDTPWTDEDVHGLRNNPPPAGAQQTAGASKKAVKH